MRLFRSEEHVDRHNDVSGRPRGAVFSTKQCWELAQRWFADRLSPDWRRRTPNEVHAIFADVGLVGPFWHLTPP